MFTFILMAAIFTPFESAEPFITHSDALVEDAEGWNQFIEGYKPVIYLHSEEKYYPILAEDYFLHSETSMHEENGAVLIPPGEMSMEEIYDLNNTGKKRTNFYFEIPYSVRWGSDPAFHTDKNGNLKMPIYAIAYVKEREGVPKIYVHYMFLYGHNGGYRPLKVNLMKLGEHKADLEHITIEIDQKTKKLERLFLAAHGREGVWMEADHKDLEYEGNTHPVVYSAKGSHATYPRAGVYIRIFGFANDHTKKAVRWDPDVIRVYFEEDERFKPETMGWIYHRGEYAKDHVDSVALKDWFGDPSKDTGREYKDILFTKKVGFRTVLTKYPIAYPP